MSDEHSPSSNLELISAYVDGELTAAERQRADALLASSAELRQWRDELVALRDDLRTLPRLRLSDDLAQRVLRQAEKEMLLGERRPAALESPTDAPREWHLRWPRGYRPWLWAGTAIAASLLVTFSYEHDAKLTVEAPRALTALQPASEPASALSPPAAVERGEVMKQVAEQAAGFAVSASTQGKAATLSDLTQDMWRRGAVVQETQRLGFNAQAGEQIAQQLAVVDHALAEALLDDAVTVVQIDVDPAQLASDPFMSVLAKNGVSVAPPASNLASAEQVKQQLQRNMGQNQQRRELGRSVAATDLDMVYVVAPPDQVQSIVSDLNNQQSTYRQVVVNAPRRADLAKNVSDYQDPRLAAAAKPQAVDSLADKRKSEAQVLNEPAAPLRKNATTPQERDAHSNQGSRYARLALPIDGAPQPSANLNGRSTPQESQTGLGGAAPGSAPLAAKAAPLAAPATAAASAPVAYDNRALEQQKVAARGYVADQQARQAPLQRVLFVFRATMAPPATVAPAAPNAADAKAPVVPVAPRD